MLIGALAQTLLTAFLISAADAPNGPDTPQPGGGPGAASLIGALVTLVLYVMFAIAWHRRFLVEEQTTIGAALRWGPRHMRFLGRFFLLGLVLVPFVAVVVTATHDNAGVIVPLSFVLLVATVLVYSRLLLIFPAIAVDERLTMQGAWQLTRGLGWRMVAIWILPLIPISVASAFASAPLVGAIVAFGLRESVTAIFVAGLRLRQHRLDRERLVHRLSGPQGTSGGHLDRPDTVRVGREGPRRGRYRPPASEISVLRTCGTRPAAAPRPRAARPPRRDRRRAA